MFCTNNTYSHIATAIFSLFLIKWLFNLIHHHIIGPYILRKRLDLSPKTLGKWALVTGCTESIGWHLAEYFASQGFNIIMVSLYQDELETTSAILRDKYNIQTKTIQADFTKTDIYERIAKEISGYEIGVLINGVGISTRGPVMFLEAAKQEELYDKIIRCNIMAVTKMCMLVMPGMVERKCGYILNVSSLGAVLPGPLIAVYCATKAYVRKLSADLRTEYEQYGLNIQSLTPAPLCTKSNNLSKPNIVTPSPETYINSVIKYLGLSSEVIGYIPHSLFYAVSRIIESISLRLYFLIGHKANEIHKKNRE